MSSKSTFDKFVFYPLFVGIGLLVLSVLLESRELALIGILGFLPIAFVIVFGLIGYVWEIADDSIPDFPGKRFLIVAIVLIVAILFGIAIFGGGGGDPSSCQSYRGEPLC